MRVHADRLHLSPSDVTAFLACEHLTTLSLAHARGEIERPEVENEQAELIFRKGLEHEHAYLESLRAQGLTVLEIPDPEGDYETAALATAEAIRAGEADVIYQGVLAHDGWRGVADFLMRQPDGTYEALDTKLARSAKPAYILQLLFYNEQLARIQGREPDHIHVLLGNGEQQTFRPQEFAAYYRRVRSRLERFVADPPPTEPYPVDHCRICDFKPICDAYWDSVDHLSRVAGVYRTQIERLEAAGITTLAQLGRAPAEPVPAGINPDSWAKNREQAELQLHARERGQDIYRLIEPQPEAGFALLPDPSPGDLFFDFEGNPFWDADGSLEYLWGILDVDGNFEPLHAHDHETERIAFETFVDLVHERLARYPDLHVYHYAPYEITALKRLMGRYGTRERELDDLLRREVFVDLYRVVRNGLRASRPGYGLKELEAFLDFERQGRGEGRRRLDRDLRAVDADARRLAPAPDRRVQPRGLHRDAPPARLAARAARRGARAVRAVPAARAGRAEADPGGEGRARRAPRAAARRRRGARGAAARLPRPRAQADLVGLLRPDRDDAGGARRGRGVDRPDRARQRARAGEEVAGVRAQLPRAGAQDPARAERDRSGDARQRGGGHSSSTARRAGSCSSAGRRSRTCRCRKGSSRAART